MDNSAIRQAAIALLARREHAQQELIDKLAQRFTDSELQIQQLITQLASEGLQSDQRFVESLVNSRKNRGKGPLFIAHELRQKGIAAELIQQHIDNNDEQWLILAQTVHDKKFGDNLTTSPAERAKRIRFMQYRGFSSEQIRQVIKNRTF